MNNPARITDVLVRLEDLIIEYGNLEVYSVNYHSDFVDVPLTLGGIKEQIKAEDGVCLIYGGSR
jgi:hypothetical protein